MSIKKDIIYPAWKLINEDFKIKKVFFFPWLFSIIFTFSILAYQSIYTYVVFFHKKQEALNVIINFFESEYFVETIVTFIIFVLLYIIIIPVFDGWLIKYIDSKNKWEKPTTWDLIWFWIHNFLKIFEFSNLTSELKFMAIVNIYLFLIRWFKWEHIKEITYLVLFFLLFSTIINILFIYTKYEIVLEKKWVIASITKSKEISIINFLMTLKLYLFMFLLNIRIIINFIVVLFFPVLIAFLFVSSLWIFIKYLAIFALIILFIVILVILGYLSWVLDIFKTAIWYNAYKIGKKRVEFIKK